MQSEVQNTATFHSLELGVEGAVLEGCVRDSSFELFLLADRFRFCSLVQTFLRQLLDDARPDRVAPHVDHRTEAVSATKWKNNAANIYAK